jgi:hypothetical protein
MTPPNHWDDIDQALQQVADGLRLAVDGFTAVVDASRRGRREHEDLQESVHRLEQMVLDEVTQRDRMGQELTRLADEVRALRERLNGGGR